jgi:hypothetical protein
MDMGELLRNDVEVRFDGYLAVSQDTASAATNKARKWKSKLNVLDDAQ